MENEARNGPELEREKAFLETMSARLNRVLADNGEVQGVKEVRTMFEGNITPAIFSSSGGGAIRGIRREIITVMKTPEMLPVVFYGPSARTTLDNRAVKFRFFYLHGLSAVFVPAMRFSDVWFAGAIVHEFWHAKRHRERGTVVEMFSDPGVEEELMAHGVMGNVVDMGTNGAYRRHIRIVATRISARSTKRFLTGVRLGDLEEIDRLFPAGISEEVSMRTPQYYIDLGRAWLEERYAEPELSREQVKLYRYVAQRS